MAKIAIHVTKQAILSQCFIRFRRLRNLIFGPFPGLKASVSMEIFGRSDGVGVADCFHLGLDRYVCEHQRM